MIEDAQEFTDIVVGVLHDFAEVIEKFGVGDAGGF